MTLTVKDVFFLLLAQTAVAQVPAISSIAVSTDTNAAVVSYNVSPDSYCYVRYGVAPGTYLWSSVSISSATASSGVCMVPITGLQDGATYYFLPTARPDPDDDINICATAGCGTYEVAATMPAASVPHTPAQAVSVAADLLVEPDTTGYSVITVQPPSGNPTGECQATSDVSAPAGYSWSVTAGQTLTSILSVIGYGTIIEIPQGVTCTVAPSIMWVGYQLPNLVVDPLATQGSIDAPNHRWIIFRTAPGGAADFPPFGVRTSQPFS